MSSDPSARSSERIRSCWVTPAGCVGVSWLENAHPPRRQARMTIPGRTTRPVCLVTALPVAIAVPQPTRRNGDTLRFTRSCELEEVTDPGAKSYRFRRKLTGLAHRPGLAYARPRRRTTLQLGGP